MSSGRRFYRPRRLGLASYGILDLQDDRASDLRPAFSQILAHDGPALIDVKFQQLSFSIQGDEVIDLDDCGLVQQIVSMTTASPSTESLNFYWDGHGIKEDDKFQNR